MSIELILTALKQRFAKEDYITLHRENGEIITKVTCEWNNPASDEELQEFALKTQQVLPKELYSFLKQTNGAKIFSIDGLDYLEIYDLPEMLNYVDEYKTNIYYHVYDKNWYMIGRYRGYGDYIFVDSQKVKNGEEDYLIYVQVGDIQRLPMNFETFLDRFIVAQGARYWLW